MDCKSGFAHAPAPDQLVSSQTPTTTCQTPPTLPKNRDNADAAAEAGATATTTKALHKETTINPAALRATKASKAAPTKAAATPEAVAVPAAAVPANPSS